MLEYDTKVHGFDKYTQGLASDIHTFDCVLLVSSSKCDSPAEMVMLCPALLQYRYQQNKHLSTNISVTEKGHNEHLCPNSSVSESERRSNEHSRRNNFVNKPTKRTFWYKQFSHRGLSK